MCKKRKKGATFQGKQRDNVNKAKLPHTFIYCIAVEISSSRKYRWRPVEGDCE